MNYVKLGKTNETVSQICLGAMLLGTAMNKDASFDVLDHYIRIGGNFIDTANCYSWWMGNGEFVGDESEEILGQWMESRGNRRDIFLATKVGGRLKASASVRDANGAIVWDKVRSEYEGLSKEVIIKEVDESLRRLRTDYIDLYYTHVYDSSTPIEETMEALHSLVKAGKIRHIGASNLTTSQLIAANHTSQAMGLTPYSVLQQEYSYLHPKKGVDTGIVSHGDKEMFDYTEAENIAFCAYSPLLKGIYANREKRNQYYNWHLFESEAAVRKLELVEELSTKLGISGNQLVLAWLLKQQPQIIPIIGFSKTEQYLESIRACVIDLPEEVIAIMNSNNVLN